MKNFYKFVGLFSIMLFSFYYTEKIAIIMQNKSPIMQNINNVEDDYMVSATNAVINGNYIIPGINGRKINKNKSFINMKSFGTFNDYYLIFDEVSPDISLNDNIDKIINKGNSNKKAVALLLENNLEIMQYLKSNNIKASLLVTLDTYENDNYFELINNDSQKYSSVDSQLDRNNSNKNICYIKSLDIEFCKRNKKYLIEETLTLNGTNYIDAKQKITSGAIILIKQNANLEEFKLLIKEIKFKGLDIIPISHLIAEKK